MDAEKPAAELYAIGEVSTLTGLSPHTIRAWERRYGAPVAKRLPSGHRRYPANQVAMLRAVAELQAYGYRPSQLLPEGGDAIQARLDQERAKRAPAQSPVVEEALNTGAAEIPLLLDRCIREMGVRQTLHEVVVPLVRRIGEAWVAGEIDIRQEHQLTEALQDVLRSTRLSILRHEAPPQVGAADVLLATLPGEIHGLGLQMLALLTALEGRMPLVLGVDLPLEEMQAASEENPKAAIAVSVSSSTGGPATDQSLVELRGMLADHVVLLAGGAGMQRRRQLDGIVVLPDLHAYEEWLRQSPPRGVS
jgi:DNA-binding transcriptional MerR regulator